jgi:hypothetical protein
MSYKTLGIVPYWFRMISESAIFTATSSPLGAFVSLCARHDWEIIRNPVRIVQNLFICNGYYLLVNQINIDHKELLLNEKNNHKT